MSLSGVIESTIEQERPTAWTGRSQTQWKSAGAPMLLSGLALLVTLAYALLVRPGSAGDEPAHFDNVKFYAHHAAMPVLGRSEVSYEGQMGPVYYVLAAIAFTAARGLGEQPAFYLIRCATALSIIPTVLLTWRIARQAAPHRPSAALLSALFVAVNPSLTAMAGSVQNDSLTIALCLLATTMAIDLLIASTVSRESLRWGIVAAIVSLAILTKTTAVYLALAIPAAILVSDNPRRFKLAILFSTVVAVCCGWWFVRNIVLYGDLTAQRALTLYRYNNNPPPIKLSHLRNWWSLLYGLVSQWWAPTEYYRDIFRAPTWVRCLVAGCCVAVVGALVGTAGMSRLRSAIRTQVMLRLLVLEVVLCMLIFVYVCGTKTLFASRCTHPTLPIIAIVVCVALTGAVRTRRASTAWAAALMLAICGSLNVWVLACLLAEPIFPFHLFVQPH